MSKLECESLIEAYVSWLRQGLSTQEIEGHCQLTTPFLDRHNDHLQVYAIRKNGDLTISDDGYILSDLRMSGVDVHTPKRRQVLSTILRGFGVKEENGCLVTEASARNLGQRVHSLVQAMLAVNDMFVMAQPRVFAFFWDDVRAFLDDNKVRYIPRVKAAGQSGFDHAIDFMIPASSSRPERLVQTINSPRKNTIGNYLFSLEDLRKARGESSEAYAFLNDSRGEVGGEIVEALQAYDVFPALWSKREDFAGVLSN